MIYIGVIIKLIYFLISLLVWGGSFIFFVEAGIPSQISAILSFLAFLASLAIFFQKVRGVLESIVETIRDLINFIVKP